VTEQSLTKVAYVAAVVFKELAQRLHAAYPM
jgi:hypothetical protein